MHAAPAVGTGRDLGALDFAVRVFTPERREILPVDPVRFGIFRDCVGQCTLGKSLYKFPGNETRQELLTTQTLESD